MVPTVSIVLLLSCAIASGFANETDIGAVVVRESSLAYEIVADLDANDGLIVSQKTVEDTTSRNDDKKVMATPRPKHTSPKLCNGHLGKQECTFKPSTRSNPQFQHNLTRAETATFDLSMVLCVAVILPPSYILFWMTQR